MSSFRYLDPCSKLMTHECTPLRIRQKFEMEAQLVDCLSLFQDSNTCRLVFAMLWTLCWLTGPENPDKDDLSANGKYFCDCLDGGSLQREVEGDHGAGGGRLVVLWEGLQPPDLGLNVVHLELGRLALDSLGDLNKKQTQWKCALFLCTRCTDCKLKSCWLKFLVQIFGRQRITLNYVKCIF